MTYYTTDYANLVLGTWRGQPFSFNTIHVCLMVSPSSFGEVVAVEYARQPVTWTPNLAAGTLTNANEVRFPPSLNSWGTINGIGYAKSINGAIFQTEDTASYNVPANRQVVFAPGDLIVQP